MGHLRFGNNGNAKIGEKELEKCPEDSNDNQAAANSPYDFFDLIKPTFYASQPALYAG